MRVASGVPGNAFVRQSAKAQSVLAIVVTPVRAPVLVWCAMEMRLACVVSSELGVRPLPGSDCVVPVTATKRANVFEVIDEPSGLRAVGTRIVSAATFGSALKARSPCQPLATYTWPVR